MKMNWLVEKGVFEENIEGIIAEIKKQGMEVKVIQYIPFQGGTYDNLYGDDDPVLFYGSLNLSAQLQREKVWCPGSFCNLKNMECTKYYAYFGKYLFNKDYIMLPLAEIIRRKTEISLMFDRGDNMYGHLFIRPSTGFKTFTGHIADKEHLTLEELGFGFYHEDEAMMCIVSSPKNIGREWRLVIGEKKVISGCQYKKNGKLELVPELPEEVKQYAEKIAQEKWEPDSVYVMDICEGDDGTLHLLEINSFSCSGLYCCNFEPIIKEVSRIALKEWELAHS